MIAAQFAETRSVRTVADVVILTKPGITGMVLAVTAAGYLLAGGGPALAALLVGAGLLAGGTAAINMWLERRVDARMVRTEGRPLPAGRLPPLAAACFGIVLTGAGAAVLAARVNPLTAAVGLAGALVYHLAYTPLKRVTPLATPVGAVAGAVPPVMGWAAARGELSVEAAILFSILFLWQLPHFLAIAWMYREDYRRAGLRMLAVDDPDGMLTANQALLQASGLLLASLAPAVAGMTHAGYAVAAVVLGILFVAFAARFAARRTAGRARALFVASVVYLPLLFGALLTGAK